MGREDPLPRFCSFLQAIKNSWLAEMRLSVVLAKPFHAGVCSVQGSVFLGSSGVLQLLHRYPGGAAWK